MTDDVLVMWVVYDHPTDYPESVIARLWEISSTGPVASASVLVAPSLEMLRQLIPPTFTRFARDPSDDAVIAEVWL